MNPWNGPFHRDEKALVFRRRQSISQFEKFLSKFRGLLSRREIPFPALGEKIFARKI
jgi:hypothetical protein